MRKIKENNEVRQINIDALETRQEEESIYIEGYAAKFNSRSQYMGFYEQIDNRAFDDTLAENNNIPALYAHDYDKVLGSTSNRTLNITKDDVGIKFSVKINPNVSYAKDVYELVRSGECGGCSFRFTCKEDSWGKTEEGRDLRTLKKVDLKEVTLTPFPAYKDTECKCRSWEMHNEDLEKHNKEKLKLELELI